MRTPQSLSPQRFGAPILVALGIFLSRVTGLVRERVFAHYLGNSEAAGAFRAALRIPNLLQNLLGEGAMSASFIPAYSRLLAEGKTEEAARLAGTVATLLALTTGALVGLGVWGHESLIDLLVPGFEGPARELTATLVRILFPGVGLLVLASWCLGVLNSHRRFFLSYVAPVLWNIAIISCLIAVGGGYVLSPPGPDTLIEWVAWSTVLGSALQFLVQLPLTIRLNRGLPLSLDWRAPSVRAVFSNFVPAVLSRGVVQISAYIDQILASFLGPLVVSAMGYGQTLAMLPVSLFGMAISAAELPEMSSATGSREERGQAISTRLSKGLYRLSFFVIPSAVAFALLGDVLAAVLFQTGRFSERDSDVVWAILAGYAVGAAPTTRARLCVSALWAMGDASTPLRFAMGRVTLSSVLGALLVFPIRSSFGLSPTVTAALLTAVAGLAGWMEYAWARHTLKDRLGAFPRQHTVPLWLSALFAAAAAYGVKTWHPVPSILWGGLLVITTYGSLYLTLAYQFGGREAQETLSRVLSKFRRSR